MTWPSPAEARVLAAADRGVMRPLTIRVPRRQHTGLGRLSQDQAVAMHEAGASRDEIAQAAGVTAYGVGHWRRRYGLCRAWVRRDGRPRCAP